MFLFVVLRRIGGLLPRCKPFEQRSTPPPPAPPAPPAPPPPAPAPPPPAPMLSKNFGGKFKYLNQKNSEFLGEIQMQNAKYKNANRLSVKPFI